MHSSKGISMQKSASPIHNNLERTATSWICQLNFHIPMEGWSGGGKG